MPNHEQVLVSFEVGTGTGTVTDNLTPHDINCSETGGDPETGTCTADYSAGSTVVLTATPDGGSTFAGWTGACAGTGTCSVMMTSAQSVTANFVPPAPYWNGSVPQFYDDPDSPPQPNSAIGTNCSEPMTINGVPQTYSCQFEYNITTFYSPAEGVDPGIGGSTKAFNDVVIAYPPTSEGSGTVVTPPPTAAAPAISGTCVMGCASTSSTITFAVNTGGTFLVRAVGYPPSAIVESGTLPAGLSFNPLTGILGGTPTSGVNGNFPISFTATNAIGSATLNFLLTVGQLSFSPSEIDFGDTFPGIPVLRLLKITNAGSSMVKFTGFNIATIPGDDSSGFEALELCPPTLDAGSSCTAILVFTGDSNLTATHAANFDITDSAPGSPQIIPMSANVIDPVASLSALILNFGNQTAGTTTAAKAVTLKNVGKTPLILSGLSISGEFAFVNTATACTGSTILAVGDSCTISVSFEPTSKGPMIGDVTINDNALLGTQIVVLTGNGD